MTRLPFIFCYSLMGLIGLVALLLRVQPTYAATGTFSISQSFPANGATNVPVNLTSDGYLPTFGYTTHAFNFRVTLLANPVGCQPDPATFTISTINLTSTSDQQLYDLTKPSAGLNTSEPWMAIGNPNVGFELLPFTTYTLQIKGGTNGIAIACGSDRYYLNANFSQQITTGADTVPPQILANQIQTTSTTASITWETFQSATGSIKYGDNLSQTIVDSGSATFHHLKLTGLQSGKTYPYQISSLDASGNTGTKEGAFTTLSIGPIGVDTITATSAAIHWDSTSATDSVIEYGPTASYGQKFGNAGLLTHHTVVLGNLSPATTYHFRVVATTAAGESTFGDNLFTTSANGSRQGSSSAPIVGSNQNLLFFNQASQSPSVLGATTAASLGRSSDTPSTTSNSPTSTNSWLERMWQFGWWLLPLLLVLLIGFFWWQHRKYTTPATNSA